MFGANKSDSAAMPAADALFTSLTIDSSPFAALWPAATCIFALRHFFAGADFRQSRRGDVLARSEFMISPAKSTYAYARTKRVNKRF